MGGDAHLLPLKGIIEIMSIGYDGFTPHKVSTSPPLHLEGYTEVA
jgi:hypothetical protein